MVIQDLYLAGGGASAAGIDAAALASAAPSIVTAGRYGVRTALPEGWRTWLAHWAGRPDLSHTAPVQVAAAALPVPAMESDAAGTTSWIATPVELRAGHTRVHLAHRGILSLRAAEQQVLAADFARTFGAAGPALLPLPAGEFLLRTPGIAPLVTCEPARSAGGDIAASLPHGAGAGALRRLIAETEMWLHGHELNVQRQARGVPPVTALWPWGAQGAHLRAAAPAPGSGVAAATAAFGRDAWLDGLWHLLGSTCRELPQRLGDLPGSGVGRALVVARLGDSWHESERDTVADALARFDAQFVSPALRALRAGELTRVQLVFNDVSVRIGRHARLRLWRRARAGLGAFA